jgi:hypothetical protein
MTHAKLTGRPGILGTVLVAIAIISMTSSLAMAQQPSGGRRTELEYLDRGFDLEGITPPRYPPEFWNTPEGRALYERQQLERFQENVTRLTELGAEDWVKGYDATGDRRARQTLGDRAEDLERVSREMIEFFEWRFQVEPLEAAAPTGEAVREGLVNLSPMVDQILATITTLTGGGIPVKEFLEMRENLARIHAVSLTLRN